MKNSLISVIIITRDRPRDLADCLQSIRVQRGQQFEVIVVDDSSCSDPTSLARSIIRDVRVVRLEMNVGVPEARNVGIREAKGDILVFLDDDSVFDGTEALFRIAHHFQKMPEEVGIITFRLIDPETGEIRPHEFPHPDRSRCDETFETTYFLGGAAAIRRRVFERVGPFYGRYFYGLEESDFAWRALQAGFRIYYVPDVVIHHKASPSTRPGWRKIYYQTRNRFWFTYSFLPTTYILTHLMVWLSYFAFQAVRTAQIDAFLRGVVDGVRGMKELRERRGELRLNPATLDRLRKLGGRVLY